jgi:hypothetical protein
VLIVFSTSIGSFVFQEQHINNSKTLFVKHFPALLYSDALAHQEICFECANQDVCSKLPILARLMTTNAAVAKPSLSNFDHALL